MAWISSTGLAVSDRVRAARTRFLVSRSALREKLLPLPLAIISLAVAGLFHLADVSHNVFKAW